MIGPACADSMAWVFRHGSLILPDRIVDDGAGSRSISRRVREIVE
jgi:hypothetical protein